MKVLKKIVWMFLQAIGVIAAIVILSAIAAAAVGFDLDASFFAGTAFDTFVFYALMLSRMNAREDWHTGKRLGLFAWLFAAMCGLRMMFILL